MVLKLSGCFAWVVFSVVLCNPLFVRADSLDVTVERLRRTVEQMQAKAGIHFGGEFSSGYIGSTISGNNASTSRRTTETNEFSTIDIDLSARPNQEIGGRLILRFHANWQNFFSDLNNPVLSRWISIDGAWKGMLSYSLGDFRKHYSPFILYTPEPEILFEPYLFSQQRQSAMAEEFLRDNDRLLQGATVNLDAELYPLLDEVHLGVFGTRLRNIETNVSGGSSVTSIFESAQMAQYAIGGRGLVTALKSIDLGVSGVRIFDDKESYRQSDTIADTLARSTGVVGALAGFKTAKLPGQELWDAAINLEGALSKADTAWYSDTLHLNNATIDGLAFRAGLSATLHPAAEKISAGLTMYYLNNGRDFRNSLAQSPSFTGSRIMNIENDTGTGGIRTLTNDVHEKHYSTFDALYRSVFKFSPSAETNLWKKAPFTKSSYSRTVYTSAELTALARSKMDPALQLIMPFGPATPNRTGVTVVAEGNFLDRAMSVKGTVSALGEVTGATVFDTIVDGISGRETLFVSLPQSTYTQAGGGLRIDAGCFIPGYNKPVELSGSFVRSQMDNAGVISRGVVAAALRSDFVNAGCRIGVAPWLTVLGGWQCILTTMTNDTGVAGHDQYHAAARTRW